MNTYVGRAPRIDRLLFLPLLYVYVFVVQMGNFFRVSDQESVPGLSTGIGVVLISVGLFRVLRTFLSQALYQLIVVLFVWISIASIFTLESYYEAYRNLGVMIGYLMLSAVVCGSHVDDAALRRLWLAMALGLGISSGLTIIDYLHIIDVPRNNDVGIVSRLDLVNVVQASGFFPRRSAMAAVFCISITGALISGLLVKSMWERFFLLGCGLAGTFCILLTHNRSGVLSALLALVGYVILSKRLGLSNRIRIGLGGVLATIVTVTIMYYHFPSHLDVYTQKLGFLFPDAEREISKSDYARVRLFVASIEALGTHPTGHGFGPIYLAGYGFKNAHNIFTSFIWASGVAFFIWLPSFLFFLSRELKKLRFLIPATTRSPFLDATLCALGAWVLNNLTHDSLATGAAWILFGAAIGRVRIAKREFRDS